MKENKIAWVFPGGGGHTTYSAGACKAVKELKAKMPDIIVSGSGGAADTFFFLANQVDDLVDIWSNKLSVKEIINEKRFWKIFGRDFLIDNICNKEYHLDINAIKNSKVDLYVGVTNTKTGELTYFGNRDKINLWDLFRATITVPFLSGIIEKSVKIKKKRFIDSRISSRAELHIEKAISLGATKILVFGNNSSRKSRYCGNLFNDLWLISKTITTGSIKFIKTQKQLMEKQFSFKIPKEVNILYIGPKRRLKIPPWQNKKEDLRKLVKKGYQDTIKNKKLKKFLK